MHPRNLTAAELADLLDNVITELQALTQSTFTPADLIENDQADS